MGVAIEFFGVDAILNEGELDVLKAEAGFFEDFAVERSEGSFAELDFAAGNAPEVGPFVGADHEDLAGGVVDEGADGGDGEEVRGGGLVGLAGDFPLVAFEVEGEFAEVLDDEVGLALAELAEGLVAGEDSA